MFPIAVNLSGRPCLVVGGGAVAWRKVSNLLRCGAVIDVVSPSFKRELEQWGEEGLITLIPRRFETSDISGHIMVFAATDDERTNQQVYRTCQEGNILVNTADDPEKCNFFVPAVLRRGALNISVSTEGRSPLLAGRIRDQLQNEYGPEYGDYLGLLGEARAVVKQTISREETRRQVFAKILDIPVLELLRQGKKEEAKGRILECIYSWPD